MKRILLYSLFASLSVHSISQADSTAMITKMNYLERSRNQNIAGWVLLVGGAVITLAGILKMKNKNATLNDLGPGLTILFIGSAALGVGCGLLALASRNKKKGNRITGFLRMEKATSIKLGTLLQHPYPALSLRLRL